MTFLSGGRMLVTERPGKLGIVSLMFLAGIVTGSPSVDPRGQVGLPGHSLDPGFAAKTEKLGAAWGSAMPLQTLGPLDRFSISKFIVSARPTPWLRNDPGMN